MSEEGACVPSVSSQRERNRGRVVTSDNNNRVVRRGPSWAPPVAPETPSSSSPVTPPPPLSPDRVVVERQPLRVAEAGGRSKPPPMGTSVEAAPTAEAPRATPLVPPSGPSESTNHPTREVGVVQLDHAPAATEARAPAPPPGPGHHGEIGREVLRRPAKQRPRSGWRWLVWVVTFGLVWVVTFGLVNLGESPADVRRRQLVARVNQTIRGDYKIAMLSLKGGVGKTTTTVGLGSTFASLRGDHVIAADANPDRGTLASRIPVQTTATVRHLLDDASNITRYSDVRAYTSQAPSRLEVLASEKDPHKSEAFSEADYRGALSVLEGFYNLVLTDCGTGLTHSAMRGVLDTADSLVLVSSPALDGAQSADATLSWLEAQGFGHLVDRTVVVISLARPGASTVNLDQLGEHFDARVRAVQVIPFDMHLAEGSEVDLERLAPGTREAFVELAAVVADDFPEAAGRHHHRTGERGRTPQ